MSESSERSRPPTVQALLCVDGADYDRFAGILRHLCVGLVDQAIPLRIAGADPRIESLGLGPVQTVIHPPLSGLTAGRRQRQLVEAFASVPPTVVHAVSSGSYRAAAAIAQAYEADLLLGVTSHWDCEAAADFKDKEGVGLQTWSTALSSVLERRFDVPRSRVEVAAPGLPAAAKPVAFSHAERDVTLVSVLSRESDPGWDRLLEAMARLVERHDAIQLFLIGEGERERSLRKTVRARNLSGHVTFAPRMSDMSPVLSGADVFVRPTAAPIFPAGTLHAMSLGLTVVSPANSVSDHLLTGETAVVCADDSAEATADGIDQVLRDRGEARRIASAGLEYVRRNHGVSAMAEAVAAAYRRLALAQTTFTLPRT